MPISTIVIPCIIHVKTEFISLIRRDTLVCNTLWINNYPSCHMCNTTSKITAQEYSNCWFCLLNTKSFILKFVVKPLDMLPKRTFNLVHTLFLLQIPKYVALLVCINKFTFKCLNLKETRKYYIVSPIKSEDPIIIKRKIRFKSINLL